VFLVRGAESDFCLFHMCFICVSRRCRRDGTVKKHTKTTTCYFSCRGKLQLSLGLYVPTLHRHMFTFDSTIQSINHDTHLYAPCKSISDTQQTVDLSYIFILPCTSRSSLLLPKFWNDIILTWKSFNPCREMCLIFYKCFTTLASHVKCFHTFPL
jgi:hypothetical protein